MTKEEIEHEELWIAGIIDSVLSRSNNNTDKFIINLKKVGYKVVKIESENERLKAEREWISVETEFPKEGQRVDVCVVDPINGNYRRTNVEYSHKYIIEYLHWMPIPKLPKPPKQPPKKPICCEKYMRCQDCPSSPNYINPLTSNKQ